MDEAKLAVVEYDSVNQRLRSSSLHGYEHVVAGAGLEHAPLRPLLSPFVTADPLGRCAAMLLPSSSVALLQASTEEASSRAARAAPVASVAGSYCLELHMLGVQRVKDTAFMHGACARCVFAASREAPPGGAECTVLKGECGVGGSVLRVFHRERVWQQRAHRRTPVCKT